MCSDADDGISVLLSLTRSARSSTLAFRSPVATWTPKSNASTQQHKKLMAMENLKVDCW